MTPEQLAARWLADVPRFVHVGEELLREDPNGAYVHWHDLLPAIARHLAPGGDLVERATAVLIVLQGARTPTRKRAASTITALLARVSYLTAQVAETQTDRDKWFEGAGAHHVASMKQAQRADQAEAEVSRLRARLARMEGAHEHAMEACRIIDEVVKEGHDNTGKMILHFLTAVEPARAALTDGGSNG
ncbi:MAG: hypothetical protein RSE12_17205 [Fuscovulum sp.]|nr:MAG: hypothetical protein RSE12_17205 [Fuscovulum sp.]